MSANTQAICSSFKLDILNAAINLTSDTIKAALYTAGTGLGAGTTAYNSSGESTGSGYTAGGATITNGVAPALTGATAYWTPSASVVWTGLTISTPFDCVLFYDATAGGNAICVNTFQAQTIAAGTFTITMPANAYSSALIQLN